MDRPCSRNCTTWWVYDYTLLDPTVESLTVCVDGLHAVVEAAVKESTRLTDRVHPEKNASNVRNYATRYELSCAVRDGKLPERQLRCRTCYGLVVIFCVFVYSLLYFPRRHFAQLLLWASSNIFLLVHK
jgi:hypothetical protein